MTANLSLIKKWWWLLILLCACATGPAKTPSPSVPLSVAVFDFEDVSPSSAAIADMDDLLTAKTIETIDETGHFNIVERQQLARVLEELHIGSSDLANRETQLTLGSITGARLMVFGCYQVIENQLRLDVRLVDVESGRVLNAVSQVAEENTLPGWLETAVKSTRMLFQY